MQLIKPSEISAKILTLLDESDERVILVSPYMKISKWYKLLNKVNTLKNRRIPIEVYVRDDLDNTATYNDLEQLGFTYKKIPHLHSKLYLNEKYGMVTSMNLLLSSEINSLEIGYLSETWKEYNDLLAYFHRYIHTMDPVHCNTICGKPDDELNKIEAILREELKTIAKYSWLWFEKNVLHINTGRNNYRISIYDSSLRISARLRLASAIDQNTVQHFSLITKKVEDLSDMTIFIEPETKSDTQSGILQLSGQAKGSMRSTSINRILKTDSAYLVKSIVKFIAATQDLMIFKPR